MMFELNNQYCHKCAYVFEVEHLIAGRKPFPCYLKSLASYT